jgi:hypothetical protein
MYQELCEKIFDDWMNHRLTVSCAVRDAFELQYCPEPYLTFGSQAAPITFVTLNPGGGEFFQQRDNIGTSRSPIRADASYRDTAADLGRSYALLTCPITQRRRHVSKPCWTSAQAWAGPVLNRWNAFPSTAPKRSMVRTSPSPPWRAIGKPSAAISEVASSYVPWLADEQMTAVSDGWLQSLGSTGRSGAILASRIGTAAQQAVSSLPSAISVCGRCSTAKAAWAYLARSISRGSERLCSRDDRTSLASPGAAATRSAIVGLHGDEACRLHLGERAR